MDRRPRRTRRATAIRRRLVALVVLAAVAVLAGLGVAAATHDPDRPPKTLGAQLRVISFRSSAVGHTEKMSLVVPPGARERHAPLLVLLHGRGGSATSDTTDALFSGLRALGDRAPIVALPNGGNHGYWHDRDSGRWGTYVLQEVIPKALRETGADPKRVALGGTSMGGYGALWLGSTHPGRFCAVGARSPALWQTGGETAAGAFDDADDFAAHDVIGRARTQPRSFAAQPLWIDAGTGDPFDPGDDAIVATLRGASVPLSYHRWPGGHNRTYWDAHEATFLRWMAGRLAACRS